MRIFKYFRLLACVVLLSSLAVWANQADLAQRNGVQRATDVADVDAYVEAAMRTLQIPGVALAIVRGDQIIHLRGFGVADGTGRPVTAQTPFRIGSITKSFTALAVMQLVEAGKIELDAPVQRYLRWFRVADETASPRITVRHLLNQTSGLSTLEGNRFWNSQEPLETVVRHLQTVDLNEPVGALFQYSNLNYCIAGLVVEAVSGQTYADYVTQHIFTPLAMGHSHATTASAQADGLAQGHRYSLGHMVADAGVVPPAYLPAGFISASAEDMAHFAIAQLGGGRYGGSAVLSKRGIDQMHHRAVPLGPIAAGTKDNYYGMGWVIGPTREIPTVWHNGDTGRFHAALMLARENNLGIVLLTNASGFEQMVAVDDMARDVLSLLTGHPPAASHATVSIPLSTLYRIIYWAILLAPWLLALGVVRGLQRWRRGDFAVLARPPHRRRKQLGRILWMVIPNLGLALFFMFGMPQISGLPFSAFRIFFPDLAYALIAVIVGGSLWSAIYAALVLLEHDFKPGRPAAWLRGVSHRSSHQ